MVALRVDQLNQLKDIFARFDMDSDGSLTILELAALLRSLGLKPSGDQIHVLLANMDSNGNGAVEFDELVNALLPHMNEEILVNQEQLMEVFHLFDRDGNGYITAAELAGCMAKMGHPLTYRELTEMIKEADADGDGVISFNEFSSVMAKSAILPRPSRLVGSHPGNLGSVLASWPWIEICQVKLPDTVFDQLGDRLMARYYGST